MSIATGGSSNGSSSLVSETVFNMADEHDVLALLRQIHLSALPLDIKNYLRDLVFSTRFGTPAPIDTAMTATFKTHGFVIATSAAAKAELETTVPGGQPAPEPRKPVALVIGFSRHAPQFAAGLAAMGRSATPAPVASATTVTPTEPAVPAAPEELPEIVLQATASAPEQVIPSTAPDAPISISPEVAAVPVTPTIDQPITLPPSAPLQATVSAAVSEPVPAAPEMVPPAAPEPAVPVSPVATASSLPPAERIALIKREVNSLVGNPVNLIDVNNEMGREYMNALLDAMKKTLGATPAQETERAMARLERAFVAVKETLSQQGSPVAGPANDTVPATPEPEGAVVVPDSVVEDAAPVPPAPSVSVAVEPEPVVVPEPVPAPVVTATPAVEPVARRVLSVASLDEVPATGVTPFTPVLEETTAPAEAPSRFSMTVEDTDATEALAPAMSAAAPAASFAATAALIQPEIRSETEVITSVAKEKQLKELMEARQAAEAASQAERIAAAANNPLMADDVNSGLAQLLSEWKLFKSSGIFGTGPSGLEHPLYKKIGQLTMAAVLAGRFEGATADIKRSIADYMNGWRYEEGIIHEQGETFENYLRRVIRHILDNQAKQ